jgi:anti-anti-sigma regulatory factor
VRAVRTEGGWIIADLAGPLSMTSAEVLREQLFRLLSPAARHLVVDLSVLVGTGHRARQLGGSLRLAAVSPEAAAALSMAGLDGKLETFGTAQSAAGAAPA